MHSIAEQTLVLLEILTASCFALPNSLDFVSFVTTVKALLQLHTSFKMLTQQSLVSKALLAIQERTGPLYGIRDVRGQISFVSNPVQEAAPKRPFGGCRARTRTRQQEIRRQ